MVFQSFENVVTKVLVYICEDQFATFIVNLTKRNIYNHETGVHTCGNVYRAAATYACIRSSL